MSERKRLYRSKREKVVAGVCGGIADYLELDPVVVRLLWVISVLFFGFGILLYIAAAIIIPENPNQVATKIKDAATGAVETRPKGNWNFAIGAVLVLFGALLLLDQFDVFDRGLFRFHFFPWRLFWPLLLIGLGIYFVTNTMTVRQSASEMKTWARKSRLHKSRDQKMLAGVCGGLAEHFNIDVSIVRILFVFAAFLTAGFGVLLYIGLAVIFPYEEEIIDTEAQTSENGNGNESSN